MEGSHALQRGLEWADSSCMYVSRWLTGHLAMFTRRYSPLITAVASPSYLQIRFRGRNFFPLLKYRTIFLEENLTRFQDRFQINYYRKLNINEALFQYLNQLISFFLSRQFFSLELSPVTVEIRIHKSSKGRREGSSVRWISIARPTESRNCFDAEEMQRSYVAFKFVLRFPPFPSPFRCSSASQPTSFVSAGLR